MSRVRRHFTRLIGGLALLLAIGVPGCDDDDDITISALECNATSCDPVCQSLLQQPPDPVRSHCSPPGPICDYDLNGATWEYACTSDLRIGCVGTCPSVDMGRVD